MKYIKDITAFITNLNLVAAENIDAWVEDPKVEPRAKDMGQDSILLYRQTYNAVISIERFPHKKTPVELLFGHVAAWLMNADLPEHDDLPVTSNDVDVLDAESADIELTFEFIEDVYAVVDPDGPISLNGQQYRLDDAVINVAEEGEVSTT